MHVFLYLAKGMWNYNYNIKLFVVIILYCYVHISCRETCSIWTCYSTCTYMYDSYYEQVFDQVCSHQGLLFIYQKYHSNYEVTFYIILRLHFINISLHSYIWISKIMFDWNLRKLIGILTYHLFCGESADYIYYKKAILY